MNKKTVLATTVNYFEDWIHLTGPYEVRANGNPRKIVHRLLATARTYDGDVDHGSLGDYMIIDVRPATADGDAGFRLVYDPQNTEQGILGVLTYGSDGQLAYIDPVDELERRYT